MTSPVARGDRILLHPSHSGFEVDVWAYVDWAELHPNPEETPWNSGPAYPWRIGYRIRAGSVTGVTADRFGTVWLDDRGHDSAAVVIAIQRSPDEEEKRLS